MQPKVCSALADLGLHAAEMRKLAGRLAEACDRGDEEAVRDLADTLRAYCTGYSAAYVKYLTAMRPDVANPDAPQLVPTQSTSL